MVLHVSSAEALHGHCVTVCDGCEYRFGCDAFRDEFEAAVVISNDSDLFEPIPVVTQELAKPVELLVPEGVVISAKLKPIASFIRTIRRTALFRSQFADHLADANGAFQKPSRW